jgi:hypothetical protein
LRLVMHSATMTDGLGRWAQSGGSADEDRL